MANQDSDYAYTVVRSDDPQQPQVDAMDRESAEIVQADFGDGYEIVDSDTVDWDRIK